MTQEAEPDVKARVFGSFWTPEQDATLRELWDTGMTCTEIGAKLNKTKSAITGRAHRLKLVARPSPIHGPRIVRNPKRENEQKQSIIEMYTSGIIDVAMISEKTGIQRKRVVMVLNKAGLKIGPGRYIKKSSEPKIKPGEVAQPMKMPVYNIDPATLVDGIGGQRGKCQFIPGDPHGERTLYCGRPSEMLLPYCQEHMRICYRPPLLQPKKDLLA